MTDQEDTISAITKDTRVTIGLTFLIVASLLGGWRSLDNRLTENQYAIELLRVEIKALREVTEVASEDRWHRTSMRLWAEALAAQNPDLSVPPVPSN